jgi:hypothetical protein
MRIDSGFRIFVLWVAIPYMFGWSAAAQTNGTPVVITKVWTVMPWYREVGGKVYDPQHSSLWEPLNGLAEMKAILPDAVVWQWCENQSAKAVEPERGIKNTA